MIPQVQTRVVRSIPSGLTLPDEDEIDPETGPGGSENTWLIRDTPIGEAQAMVEHERRVIEAVDTIASDFDDFVRLVDWFESGDTDDRTDLVHLADQIEPLEDLLFCGGSLEGLDLGVAGLTLALSAIGALPERSGRGDEETGPHVRIWTTPAIGRRLLRLCEAADCSVAAVPHDRTIEIWAPSVRHTNTLAALLVPRVAVLPEP